MRLKGTLVDWNDDRGFGFIEPADGGSRVFCHVKAFEVRVRRPMAGDRLTYDLAKGPDGRTSAARVRPVGLEEAGYQWNVGTNSKSKRARVGGASARNILKPGIAILLIVAVAGYYAYTHQSQFFPKSNDAADASQSARPQSDDVLRRAFDQRLSGIQVNGSGLVERILSDDSEGSKHQRFIVRLASRQTLLIAHNVDLAQRLQSLAVGDRIEFSGEYEWNDKGGVVHWTHHDPNGRHESGWIKHNGRTFQ